MPVAARLAGTNVPRGGAAAAFFLYQPDGLRQMSYDLGGLILRAIVNDKDF
jgi:hypothetical protein